MKKKQLKIKSKSKISLAKILKPFKNPKNKKIAGTVISLLSILIIIAFTSHFSEWKADDSMFGEDYKILNNEAKNQIGSLGAKISFQFINLWFGISAFFIPFITFLIGLRILESGNTKP